MAINWAIKQTMVERTFPYLFELRGPIFDHQKCLYSMITQVRVTLLSVTILELVNTF